MRILLCASELEASKKRSRMEKIALSIYGDEIIACGYSRSIWRCAKCERTFYREELYMPEEI